MITADVKSRLAAIVVVADAGNRYLVKIVKKEGLTKSTLLFFY